MPKPIDFFFAIGSPYVYLGLDPIAELASRHDVLLEARPALLIPENGGIFSRDRPEPRRQYWLKEIARWAELRGKTLVMSDRGHLSDPTPASMMIVAAALQGLDWLTLTDALQSAFWSEERADIGKPEVRGALADKAGFDGAALLALESSDEVMARWEENLAMSKRLGVFGMPTFAYDGELYWGQDNLDFLERHLNSAPLGVQ
ncbi:2-hydroxychromene-2-carboxylate isomerase [Tropicimonas sp. IMCC34043]|uniref:2-hydroxychromene-2-carboxylate isomerase n=1 Tax=Tropicimonas sp. IMCC34043 TaxID=2248760 RepID=UPI000E247494|nr:DsbA family protein [Tropicimonas sp. IMCC34043]